MISDFKAGTKVCQAVLLRVQKIGNSSNGGVFARGLLEDNSGKMPFIVFEAGIVDKMRSMEGPKVMMVGGMVDINKFSNDMTLQLVLQRRGRPYREIGSVGLEIANRKRLEQTERIHRRECFRTEKGRYLELGCLFRNQ